MLEFKTVAEIESFNRERGFDFLDNQEYNVSDDDPVYHGLFFILRLKSKKDKTFYKIAIVNPSTGELNVNVFSAEQNRIFNTRAKAVSFLNKYIKAISYLNRKVPSESSESSEAARISGIIYINKNEETVKVNFKYSKPSPGKTCKYIRFKIDPSELRNPHSDRVLATIRARKIFTRDIISFYQLLLGQICLDGATIVEE